MELVYTPLTMEDHQEFFRLAGDPRVAVNMRFDRPETPEDSDRVLADYLAEGNRAFGIRLQPEGTLIGVFAFFKETSPEVADLSEMLLPEYWGRGLGQQILTDMTGLARTENWYRFLDGYILQHNSASRKMAQSIGFREKERLRFPDLTEDLIVYRLEI